MQRTIQDIRYTLRTLSKYPGFTLTVLGTLTLGIGANAAIFSAVNGILLNPLPYEESDDLVQIWETRPMQAGRDRNVASFPDFEDWRSESRSFQSMAGVAGGTVNLVGKGEPEELLILSVTEDFFKVFRAAPLIGRTFGPQEFVTGQDAVAVLSHGLWQRRFGSDEAILGSTIDLSGELHTVVGVMPADFRFVPLPELWRPLTFEAMPSRGGHFLRVFGRLAEDVSVEQARAELKTIAERLEDEFPMTNTGHYVAAYPLQDEIVRTGRRALLVLMGAVGLVLLLICVNVASMQFARSLAREREMALRTTLGATRRRIVSLLLWESGILAIAAGLMGTLLAYASLGVIQSALAQAGPMIGTVSIDTRVLLFILVVSLGTAVISGLVPSLRLSRPDLGEALKEGGARAGSSLQMRRIQAVHVVAEFALAIVLLTAAGLVTRSFSRLVSVDPGFEAQGLLVAQLSLPPSRYGEPQQRISFVTQLLAGMRNNAKVQGASVSWLLPFTGRDAGRNFTIENRPPPQRGDVWNAAPRIIDPSYFETMAIPLVRGRAFSDRDGPDAPGVMVVNQTMAQTFWQQESPIGKRLRIGGAGAPWYEIIGVAGDVSHRSLSAPARAEMYIAYAQSPVASFALVVRAEDPISMVADLRQQVSAIDAKQPLSEVATMTELMGRSLSQPRTSTIVLAAFALAAALLAAIGIYGVMSYMVSQRIHEIGIRMALGAQRSDVLKMVLTRGMLFAFSGILLGLLAALAASGWLQSILFEVSATDATTYAAVAALLATVGLVANYLPARRATRLDPRQTLRQE